MCDGDATRWKQIERQNVNLVPVMGVEVHR